MGRNAAELGEIHYYHSLEYELSQISTLPRKGGDLRCTVIDGMIGQFVALR